MAAGSWVLRIRAVNREIIFHRFSALPVTTPLHIGDDRAPLVRKLCPYGGSPDELMNTDMGAVAERKTPLTSLEHRSVFALDRDMTEAQINVGGIAPKAQETIHVHFGGLATARSADFCTEPLEHRIAIITKQGYAGSSIAEYTGLTAASPGSLTGCGIEPYFSVRV